MANNFLREASKLIKAGEDANIHPNDPYLKAIREMRGALWNIFISLNYRDLSFDALIKTQIKLMDILEQTKDTELETQKLSAEKNLYDSMFKTLEGQLKSSEERAERREKVLLDQITKLSNAMSRIESKVVEIDEDIDEKGSSKQIEETSEPLPEGELTQLEKQVIGTMKSKKKMIEYLTKRHPKWTNSTIAGLLGVDEVYVSQFRVSNNS